jgi:hypothetical protein
MEWVVNATPQSLYAWEWLGAHFVGGWVSPRTSLDRCGKFAPAGIRSTDGPACTCTVINYKL